MEELSNRTKLLNKNVKLSSIIKPFDKALGFVLVPMLLGYLDNERYGLWLTITSLISWLTYFDFGLGQGLRVHFAKSIAEDDFKRAKIFVSTTYILTSIIVLIFISIFLLVKDLIDWSNILGIRNEYISDVRGAVDIIVILISFQMIAKLIGTIAVADQMPLIRDLINLVAKILVVITVYALTIYMKGSLIVLSLINFGLPLLTLLVASIYLFKTRYKDFRPSLNYAKVSYFGKVGNLSWKFFLINLSMLVIMSTDNLIIVRHLGSGVVTSYQIVNKYFSVLALAFSIMVTPLWSASSDALIKRDIDWVRIAVKKLHYRAVYISLIGIVLLFSHKWLIKLWIGEDLSISPLLVSFWLMFVILTMFNGIYFSVLNAVGDINVSLAVYTLGMLLNIPLSIMFIELGLGSSGVILATLICQAMHTLYLPRRYKKVLINFSD